MARQRRLQSIKHLQAINTIARALPDIKFWLPTREYKIVKSFIDEGFEIVDNLTIRLSAYFKPSATISTRKLEFRRRP